MNRDILGKQRKIRSALRLIAGCALVMAMGVLAGSCSTSSRVTATFTPTTTGTNTGTFTATPILSGTPTRTATATYSGTPTVTPTFTIGWHPWPTQTPFGTPDLWSIQMLGTSGGYIVGGGGTILVFDPAASSWRPYLPSPTTNDLFSVSFDTTGKGWAVGANNTVVSWGGSTWSALTNLPTPAVQLYSVSAFPFSTPTPGNPFGFYTSCAGGFLFKYSVPSGNLPNNGSWTQILPVPPGSPTVLPGNLEGVSVTQNVWAAGVCGLIVNANNISAPTVVPPPNSATPTIFGLMGDPTSTSAFAVGAGGAMWTFTTGSWYVASGPPPGVTDDLHGIAWLNGSWWFVGNTGRTVHYDSGSSTWRTFTAPTTANLMGVYMTSQTSGWGVGQSGTILKYF